MLLKKEDAYECPKCGCECTVTEEPAEGEGGDDALTCSWGETMEKKLNAYSDSPAVNGWANFKTHLL